MRKSSSASNPNCDGELLPTVAVTSGRAGRLMRQVAGIRANDASAFERRNIPQELQRLLWIKSQRMINLAAVDYGFQPRAMLGGALDRYQQRKEAFAVPCAAILLHGFAERQMLRLGVGRKPCRVSRQERERGPRPADSPQG